MRLHDTGDAHIPGLVSLASTITDGQFSYWDAQKMGGVDRLATGPVKLDVLMFTILPGWLAYGVFIWLQRFVAGYFMFRLLTDDLHLNTRPAILAGLAYSLFAQATINQQWDGFTLYDGLALPGLPFYLWAVSRLNLKRRVWPFLLATALGVGLSFSSQFAFVLFLIPVIFAWFGFVVPKRGWKFWAILTTFIAAWLLAESPVLWAGFLNAPLSQRANWIPDSPLSAGLVGQLAFVFGLIRDNVVMIGLIGVSMVFVRRRDRRLIIPAALVLTSLIFIGSYTLIQRFIFDHARSLAGFQFDRVYLVVPFLVIVGGSAGLDLIGPDRTWQWPHATNRWPLQATLLGAAVGVVGLQSIAVKPVMLKDIALGRNYSALYAQPDIQALATRIPTDGPFRVATIFDPAWPLHPAYLWSAGLETVDGYANLYPQRYQDFWEQVLAPLISVDQERYNYFHFWGNRVYLFSPTAGWPDRQAVQLSDYYNLELLSLANVRYIISTISLRGDGLTLLPSNVRDLRTNCAALDRGTQLNAMLRGQCLNGPPLYIYENHRVLPRFFLVQQAQVFDDSRPLLTALRTASVDELRSRAYMQRSDIGDLPLDRLTATVGAVTLERYSPDRIALDAQTDGASILMVANSYSPYWYAHIDGILARVFPADQAFQGIYVPAGQHHVVMEYDPPYAVRLGQ